MKPIPSAPRRKSSAPRDGLAGIGYQLLRLADPCGVPSLLTLEGRVEANVERPLAWGE